MKYIVVLGDGMADRPIKELGDRTPLEVAKKPGMDRIASEGRMGLLRTLREDMPYGSDIANMSILGYDPKKYCRGGRGPLEAAAMGIDLSDGDIAFRANLITAENGVIKDYSGGQVSSEESRELIAYINGKIDAYDIELYSGVGYRNLLVLRDCKVSYSDLEEKPPHDIVGRPIRDNLIVAKNKSAQIVADRLNSLMQGSKILLDDHPINLKRREKKKDPANMLWLWGGGARPKLPGFRDRYGIDGGLISAVDLLRGIAAYAGLEVIHVPGATGYLDTDYSAKARYALESLDRNDFVYIHVEAPDEAGHEAKIKEKIAAIEQIDRKIVSPILKQMRSEEYSIAVLPDHATPIEARTHTPEPVPFAVYSTREVLKDGLAYSEKDAARGSFGLMDGTEFMDMFIGKKKK